MKRVTLFLGAMLITIGSLQPQGIVPAEWKFLQGDHREYADSSHNDYWWHDISPLQVWEKQGYAGYDGYAWYRVKVVVPSSMRKRAERYGGLKLTLGRIDDVDETWFNGHPVGATGKMPPSFQGAWDVPRTYTIPAEYVSWDRKNTIAIRVYDAGGDGGLYGGPFTLVPRDASDLITPGTDFSEKDMIIRGGADAVIPVTLTNGFPKKFRAALTLTIDDDFGSRCWEGHHEATVRGNSTGRHLFRAGRLQPGFYRATLMVNSRAGSRTHHFRFGYEPEQIASEIDRQPDFLEFWEGTLAELAAVEPHYRLIRIDSLCTPKHDLFLVEMRSLGNVLIRGWYRVPVKPGQYPAIMQVPGHGSAEMPEYIAYGDDVIGLGLNIRGHGNSRDDVDPGFPGYLLSGISGKEEYIYRGAYMDCIRGIDFLCSRPEVDRSRIAVEGASQGGALTFATAALAADRIAVCAPQVPFLSDFRNYFRMVAWPASEFAAYIEKNGEMTWDELYTMLSYFDIKNLAPLIRAPMIMGVGLLDDVCPPAINFAAWNQVTADKKYIVYPDAGHGLPGEFYNARMEWIRSWFNRK